jgi:K+-transporting ATPase ATPase A chain
MVGRTPEYLGKKIEAYDVKMSMLYVLIFPLIILTLTASSCFGPRSGWPASPIQGRTGSPKSSTLHLRRWATTARPLPDSTPASNTLWWYNVAMGWAMLGGRFLMMIPVLALAGNLAMKKSVPPSPGTFPVNTSLFTVLLIGVILILGALTFFPALSLGPILEHLLLKAGQVF